MGETTARVIKGGAADGSTSPGAAIRTLGQIAEEARTVVLDARKEAARIAAEARAQADAARQAAARKGYDEGVARGQNDGYQDGREQGLTEAREQFAADADGLIEQAGRIVEALSTARAELVHDARCEMLDFAREIAEKVVGRVATSDPAAARRNLRKALELSSAVRDVRVKVNPAQHAALEEYLPRLVEALGHTGQVRLLADEEVSPGGVKLFSEAGEIDATIETQLANVVEALLGARGQEQPGRYRPTEPACGSPVGGDAGQGKRAVPLASPSAARATGGAA